MAAALALAVLVALPILVVLSSLLQPGGDSWTHLVETVLWSYTANTVILALGVAFGTACLGVGAAWLVTLCSFPGRRIFEWALFLPLAIPAYVLAYTYADLLQFAGPVQTFLRDSFDWSRADYWFPDIRSLGGAVMVLSFALYPYVYMLARAAFLEQSVCVLEVSRTLGCSPWRGFWKVALPLARPAIVGGVALALMETLGDFGAVSYLAVKTFTVGIFHAWRDLGDLGAALKLAAVLTIMVFALLALERRTRNAAKFHHTSARYRPLPNYQLKGIKKWLAVLGCLFPLTMGFLLPGAQLLAWTLNLESDLYGFWSLVWNSIMVSGITAVLALGLALVLAFGVRLTPSRPMFTLARLSAMGYAVPGLILAVGIIAVFSWAENGIDGWMRQAFGVSTGLFLSGTLVALIFAYLVRFLAVSFNAVEASFGKLTPSLDAAGRTLGASPGHLLRRVHMPLISGSMLTAALLVFVDVMKELPATYVLRPFDFNTLAVRTFELASDEQLAQAAAPALAIVAVGLLPVILMSRAISRSRPGELVLPERPADVPDLGSRLPEGGARA